MTVLHEQLKNENTSDLKKVKKKEKKIYDIKADKVHLVTLEPVLCSSKSELTAQYNLVR